MSEDVREEYTPAPEREDPAKPSRILAAKSAEKERLAAALRENLKRRKAQISARRTGQAS